MCWINTLEQRLFTAPYEAQVCDHAQHSITRCPVGSAQGNTQHILQYSLYIHMWYFILCHTEHLTTKYLFTARIQCLLVCLLTYLITYLLTLFAYN